jgi:hypothetical protein
MTAALVALGLHVSCAFPPADLHLAPLYSHHRLAAGGSDHEGLGGLVEVRSEPGSTEVALRPLFRRRTQGETSETDVLWPLGHFRSDPEESWQRFFPFWWYKQRPNERGERETDWAVFPFLFGGSGTPENSYFAFFPFGGTLRDFFTYDSLTFVLFPIYGETHKSPGNQRSYGILVPFTGWGRSDDGLSWWRIWPLAGHSEREGHYDRWFAMWPFWHSERNGLDTEQPSDEWLLFPFYGEVDQGAFHARSVLWPFFGWDWNNETGYSAYDGPWPLVKFIRNGSGRPYSHSRVLPFYAAYRSAEIESTNYLWPIVWLREETTPDAQISSTYLVPFFYTTRATRRAPAGESTASATSTDLVWPVYRQETREDGSARAETLWPIPYPKLEGFRENWFPFFSLFSRQEAPDGSISDRLFLDLFRLEKSPRETRWSVPVLGGHRSTEDVSEWSLLLGLVRWRSGPEGTRLLLPAIPGPGFEELPR